MTTDSRNWYYLAAGQRFGPVDLARLQAAYATGQLSQSDLVWADGMTEWQQASTLIDLTAGQSPGRLDNWAVWSFILGLVSVFGLFAFIMLPSAVAGLVLGIRARRSAKRGLAIAGIVLSSFGLLIWVVLFALLAIVMATIGWDQFVVEMLAAFGS